MLGCPGKDGLDLTTPDRRLAARCVTLTAGQVGSVEAPGTGPLQIRLGGDAPEQRLNYAAWADLVGLDVPETATPTARGWCRPGDWSVTAKTALLCTERAAYEGVMGTPAGEERRKALLAARGCHIVLRSNLLMAGDPRRASEGRADQDQDGAAPLRAAFGDPSLAPGRTAITARLSVIGCAGPQAPARGQCPAAAAAP